jgi:hypothetical protein
VAKKKKHRFLVARGGGTDSREDVNEYGILPPGIGCSPCTVSTVKEESKTASSTLWPRLGPCLPVRAVAEQLVSLGSG